MAEPKTLEQRAREIVTILDEVRDDIHTLTSQLDIALKRARDAEQAEIGGSARWINAEEALKIMTRQRERALDLLGEVKKQWLPSGLQREIYELLEECGRQT